MRLALIVLFVILVAVVVVTCTKEHPKIPVPQKFPVPPAMTSCKTTSAYVRSDGTWVVTLECPPTVMTQ